MPRTEWAAMPQKKKAKARFLDFNIHTQQTNSGIQQYGAGLKNDSTGLKRSVRSARGGYYWDHKSVPTTRTGSNFRRELMAEVVSSVAFTSTQYRIQPADSSIFPWVGSIAAKYQKWRCVNLWLEYVPTVTEYAAAGTQGRIVLAANYDSLDANLTDIAQAETISPNSPGMPDEHFVLALNPRQVSPVPLLVRPGQVPAGGTITSFDGGVFYVIVNGIASGVTDGTKLGEVFVNYEFEFYDPIIPGLSVTPQPTHSTLALPNWAVTTTVPSATWSTLPDCSVSAADGGWNGLGITGIATGSWTFPPGRYMIHYKERFDGAAVITQAKFSWWDAVGAVENSETSNNGLNGTQITLSSEFVLIVPEAGLTMSPKVYIVCAGTISPVANHWGQLFVMTC